MVINTLITAIKETDYQTINVEVVFGNPRCKCSGSGICQVYILNRGEQQRCNCMLGTPAQLLYLDGLGVLGLMFDHSIRSSKLWERYFSNELFLVEETWTASPDFYQHLNQYLEIRCGLYCVSYHENGIVVWFN